MDDATFMKKASLDTFCDTLEGIDANYGLQYHYGREIQDPKDVCYAENVFELHK